MIPALTLTPCLGKAFVLIILMVIWTEGLYDLTEAWRAISDLAAALLQNVSLKEYDWLEFFAGRANATHAVRLRGGIGARFDLI